MTVRVGIVGSGFMGRTWAEVAANHATGTSPSAVTGGRRGRALGDHPPDHRRAARLDSLGGRIMRVDPASGEVLGSLPLAGHFFHRAPSGDIWVGALNGTVVRLTTDWIELPGEDEPAR